MTVAGKQRPLVSLVLPAFNEATILEANLGRLCAYLDGLGDEYRWEILVVNDGSRDETGAIADRFAATRDDVRVLHHFANFGIGRAFKTAFRHSRGDYVITFDADLSYGPEHIPRMLARIRETRAAVVLASAYMEGGSVSNVPALRLQLSVWANRFLSLFARGRLSTLTCMVRAYDGPFVRSLRLRSSSMDVMPELVYKAMILRARIEQVPAHLDWGAPGPERPKRRSSMRIAAQVISTLLAGFVFRPFMFLVVPGAFLMLFSAYVNAWMFIHYFEQYFNPGLAITPGGDRVTTALAVAYGLYPYTFVIGLISLVLAIQLLGLGIVALQSKRYFEEMYFLTSGLIQDGRSRGPERSEGELPLDVR